MNVSQQKRGSDTFSDLTVQDRDKLLKGDRMDLLVSYDPKDVVRDQKTGAAQGVYAVLELDQKNLKELTCRPWLGLEDTKTGKNGCPNKKTFVPMSLIEEMQENASFGVNNEGNKISHVCSCSASIAPVQMRSGRVSYLPEANTIQESHRMSFDGATLHGVLAEQRDATMMAQEQEMCYQLCAAYQWPNHENAVKHYDEIVDSVYNNPDQTVSLREQLHDKNLNMVADLVNGGNTDVVRKLERGQEYLREMNPERYSESRENSTEQQAHRQMPDLDYGG